VTHWTWPKGPHDGCGDGIGDIKDPGQSIAGETRIDGRPDTHDSLLDEQALLGEVMTRKKWSESTQDKQMK
jgi:hypothetical protein